ncbi:tetratricopeptide repeat protein [Nocardia sp. CA-128927]|uniref:tetratricopeptide repeat protein n=1 Tax=Nocardia sp. CA-128927 TaxID=3239975 RepID=UPI003D99CF8C
MTEASWPSALLLHGRNLLEDGHAAAAIVALGDALAECAGPEAIEHSAECLYWIGSAYGAMDEIQEATDAYCRAADLLADQFLTELSVRCAEMAGRGFDLLERPDLAVPYLRRAGAGLWIHGDDQERTECDEILGHALAATEQHAEAMIVLRRAADHYLDLGRIVDAALCRESCGEAAMGLDDAQRVRDEHRAARELYERAGESDRLAICSYTIGSASMALGDTETAEREFLRAKAEATVEQNIAGVADCDYELADLYLANGRTEDALAALSAAAVGYAADDEHLKSARAYNRVGQIHGAAGRLAAAIPALAAACTESLAANEPELAAGCEVPLGIGLQNCSRYPEAIAAFQRARDYYARADNTLDAAECDMHLATVRMSQGDLGTAESLLRDATTAFEQHRDDPRYAHCLRYSAAVQGFRGDVTRARAMLVEARRYAAAAGDMDQVRGCEFEEARLIIQSGGNLPDAITLLDSAGRGAEQAKEWAIAAQCQEFSGVAQFMQNRYAEAEHSLEKARDAYTLLGLSTEIGTADLHLGLVYSETGRFVQAEEAIRRGRTRLVELGADHYLAHTENLIGTMHLKAGRYPLAAEAFRSAEAALSRSGLPFQSAVTRLNHGSAVMLQGEFAAGIALMESAIEVFETDAAYSVYQAMALLNIGCTERNLDRGDAGLAHIASARKIYADLGSVVSVAKCDLMTAACAAADGRPGQLRAALDLGLPAAVFIDAQRFGFAAAQSRISWEALHRVLQSTIFDWAHRLGDAALLADLVETAINSGTHVAEHYSAIDQSDLQAMMTALAVAGADSADTVAPDPAAERMSGAAAALISGAILPMHPSPRLRMPDGHVALAPYLEAADRLYTPIERPGEVSVW